MHAEFSQRARFPTMKKEEIVGIASPDEAPGYLGDDGFYSIIARLSQTDFPKEKAQPEEFHIHVERFLNDDTSEEPSRYSFLFKLCYQDLNVNDRAHDFVASLDGDGDIRARVGIHNDSFYLICESVGSFDALDSMLAQGIPNALERFSRAFPEIQVAERSMASLGTFAQRSAGMYS